MAWWRLASGRGTLALRCGFWAAAVLGDMTLFPAVEAGSLVDWYLGLPAFGCGVVVAATIEAFEAATGRGCSRLTSARRPGSTGIGAVNQCEEFFVGWRFDVCG